MKKMTGPIGYDKVRGKAVDNDEIVKAFEYSKGKLVHLSDEDFEAVEVEGRRTIDLQDFALRTAPLL
jgi:non-homologous end joining protein Ku